MKYGFIGAGNICSAVITGAVKNGVPKGEIFIYDTDKRRQDRLAEAVGVTGVQSENEIIENAELIFFGLKPDVLCKVLPVYKNILETRADEPLVVSFAAGINMERLCGMLPWTRVVRVLPNLNAAVGNGIAAYYANNYCSDRDIAEICGFMSTCGGVTELDEKYFDLFSVLSGSTPAFTYMFIDSLARAAQLLGMDKRTSLEIAAQSVLGSAKMILETDEHPWELIDRVCSPGGLTIEGICALQESSFENIVVRAVERAVNKNEKLKE